MIGSLKPASTVRQGAAGIDEQAPLLRALRRQSVARTPVWIMRQAGRYLPEYRQTRARAGSFLALLKNPELACEVTLQPLRRFPLDAAILFSDILTIPDALGLGLSFAEGEGPRFARPLRSGADIAALPVLDLAQRLPYVFETVERVRAGLDPTVPLLGFSGSPWTLATYMIEGAGSREFTHAKGLLYRDPDALKQLLALLAEAVADYLLLQLRHGVQAVMLFDTWGGILAQQAYREFSLDPVAQITGRLRADPAGAQAPIILFTKGGGQWLEAMAGSGCDALGLDWTTSLGEARRRVGDRVALQGNLDPAVLRTSPAIIRAEVARVLEDFGPHGPGSGHVFNLGHGITPDVPPQNLAACIDAVHALSPALHHGNDA